MSEHGESEHDEFVRRATMCVSMAAGIDDPGYKAALLEMAHRWRQLAAEAKADERARSMVLDNRESDR